MSINTNKRFFLSIFLSASLLLGGCAQAEGQPDGSSSVQESGQNTILVPFEKTQYTPSVEPYSVKPDLSNIENIDQFPNLSEAQKELLARNGFFVRPTLEEQLFYVYEHNEYNKIPSFVTTDSVLQVYHIFYDYSLRTLEAEKLSGILISLTDEMLSKSINTHSIAKEKQVVEASLKNIAFFATAQLLLHKELPQNIPAEAADMANREYSQIVSESGFARSVIFPFELDYSQYRPRGHYTRSEDLKNYFKAMMWYGQAPFPLKDSKGEYNKEQTLQALLITRDAISRSNGDQTLANWEKIYGPTLFYVGGSDDLSIYDYKSLLSEVYGKDYDVNSLSVKSKLEKFFKMAEALPDPQIQPKYTSSDTPCGKQFRFMGQRYIPDSEILQSLVEPFKRPAPKGLDVMAATGSERARELLLNHYGENDKWSGYSQALEKVNAKFGSLSEDKWKSNMYYGWMWTLQGLFKEYGQGYPSFMTNTAWTDKSLSTALGSWSELKHDTVLYGKQSGAECGGGEEPPEIKGYVEPSIDVYERLLWLNKYSMANLKERGILDGSIESKLTEFNDLLEFLISCSVKELQNEELTSDEYYQLLTYGGMLEYLTSSFAGDGMRWYEITSEADKNMAVISDIHTVAPNGYLEVGVGPAHEIYVAVPIGGKLYITRGAVFSYYEFINEGKRLTDEEWQTMHKENKQPAQQDWIREYMTDDDLQIPVPAQPYESGC